MQLKPLVLNGPSGDLEAMLHTSESFVTHLVAIVLHPHPLHEGTMHNKVVTTAAKSLNQLNITTIRFNYRGVGNSAGEYGNIDGEVLDGKAVVDFMLQEFNNPKIVLVGFSFGSYIAATLSTLYPANTIATVLIAPPVTSMPFNKLTSNASDTSNTNYLVIQGGDDEIVDPAAVLNWYNNEFITTQKTYHEIIAGSHFFHGKLIELQQVIQQYIQPLV